MCMGIVVLGERIMSRVNEQEGMQPWLSEFSKHNVVYGKCTLYAFITRMLKEVD